MSSKKVYKKKLCASELKLDNTHRQVTLACTTTREVIINRDGQSWSDYSNRHSDLRRNENRFPCQCQP